MHVSQKRFDLTVSDNAGIQAFKKHIWFNSELCSHCFSRVRSVGDTVSVRMSVHSHEMNKYYERTELGSQEHTPFDDNKRYGTCFCENCGRDLKPNHKDLSWKRMREFAVNLFEYTRDETSLNLNRENFAKELAHLRLDRRDTAGKESQIFAVAFSRALETDVTPSGTITERAQG